MICSDSYEVRPRRSLGVQPLQLYRCRVGLNPDDTNTLTNLLKKCNYNYIWPKRKLLPQKATHCRKF